MTCPNVNSEEWKNLVEAVGLEKAKDAYVLNGSDIPSIKMANRLLRGLATRSDGFVMPTQDDNEDTADDVQVRGKDNVAVKLNDFLNKIGVKVDLVDGLTIDGKAVSGVGLANMALKAIQLVKGKADIGTMGEETAHFFVEMLDPESELYKEMDRHIEKYDVYNDTVTNYGDTYQEMYPEDYKERLRKEAMGKLIARHIFDNQLAETGPKQSFAVRWWDKVKSFFGGVFSKVDSEKLISDVSAFNESAQRILSGTLNDLNIDRNINGTYFQLAPEGQRIANLIEEKDSQIVLEPGEHVYTFNGKRIKESVTDYVSRINPFRGNVDDNYKEVTQGAGTMIHGYIENSINRAIETLSGNVTTRQLSTDENYTKIADYFSEFVNRPEFKGGKFLTEVKVVDEKTNRAGTIDLAIVMPDGTVHIYDWKSTNFHTVNGEVLDQRVSPTKERSYNLQIGDYKRILKSEYGVTKFGHLRVIPIQTILATTASGTKVLSGIKIGGDESYLKPIITDVERTGIAALDNVIGGLVRKKHNVQSAIDSITKKDGESKKKIAILNKKLTDIAKAITEIHFEHKINQFLDFHDAELTSLAKKGVGSTAGTLDNYSDADFDLLYKNIQDIRTVITRNLNALHPLITEETTQRIDAMAPRLIRAESLLMDEVLRRSQLVGNTVGMDNINAAQKETGWWGRYVRYASQQTNAKTATLWRLVDRQKQKSITEFKGVVKEIEHKVEALMDWGAKNGHGGMNAFKLLIDQESKSNQLIKKYSKSYRDSIHKAYENVKENADFLKENIVFDREKYDKVMSENVAAWNAVEDDEIVQKRVDWFENKFDVEKNINAYGANNFFTSWKDAPENHSPEYRFVQNNAPLKDFYDTFVKYTNEWRDVYGLDKDGRFIWNVKSDITEKIMHNGLSLSMGMPSMTNQLENAEWEHSEEIPKNELGEKLHFLPKHFIRAITKVVENEDGTLSQVKDEKNTSQDLGKVLALAGGMAINYKYMAEIEDMAKILQLAVRPENSQEIITDFKGRPVPDLIRGGVEQTAGSATTMEGFNDIMNFYLYGVRNNTKEITMSFLGKEFKLYKSLNQLSKYFVGKTLALNPMSIGANLIGGEINAAILGVGGKYFNNKQYHNAIMNWIPGRNEKAYAVMGLFDIMDGSKIHEKANELSVDFLTRNLTYDKLFIGHEVTDGWIRNAALLGMMQNFTIRDGVVVKKNATESSLMDLATIKDGKLEIEGLTDDLYYKFRAKALGVGEKILGNSTRENMRASQLTVAGRAVSMFRSWIPRMADVRFGELRKDYDIDEYEYGRYRAFVKTVVDDQFGKVATNLKNTLLDFGILGFKPYNSTAATAGVNARIEELYYKHLHDEPDSKITLPEFKEVFVEGLKTSMMEFQMLGVLSLLLVSAKGAFDDDKKDSTKKSITATLARTLSELAFFSGVGFNDILKNAIPLTSLVTQISGLFGSVFTDVFGGPQPKSYKNSLQRARAFFPIMYAFDRLESMMTKGQ